MLNARTWLLRQSTGSKLNQDFLVYFSLGEEIEIGGVNETDWYWSDVTIQVPECESKNNCYREFSLETRYLEKMILYTYFGSIMHMHFEDRVAKKVREQRGEDKVEMWWWKEDREFD